MANFYAYLQDRPWKLSILVFLGLILTASLIGFFVFTSQNSYHSLLVSLSLATVIAGLLVILLSHKKYIQAFIPNASSESLAFIRIITALLALASLLKSEFLNTVTLPEELIITLGFLEPLRLIPGFDFIVTNPVALIAVYIFSLVSLFFVMIGWRTKTFIFVSIFLYLLIGGLVRQYVGFWHSGLAALYFLPILLFVPCSDSFSVDNLIKKKRKKNQETYSLSRYLFWITLVLIYANLVFSKLRNTGFDWWGAENIRGYLYFNPYYGYTAYQAELSSTLFNAPDILFQFIGISTLLIQFLFVLVLFSSFARKVMPVLMAFFHLGIFLFMGILFYDLIILQVIFFNFTWVKKKFFTKHKLPHDNTPSHHLSFISRYRIILFFIIFIGLFQWHTSIERYPLTAWAMYSHESNVSHFSFDEEIKIRIYFNDGDIIETTPIRLRRALNIRNFPPKCYLSYSDNINACQQFYNFAAKYLNATQYKKPVTAFEMRTLRWNFKENTIAQEPIVVNRMLFSIQQN